MPERHMRHDERGRLLLALTGGFIVVLIAVVSVCVFGGARWHVLTSSYQVFLIGMFCGGLLATTLVLGAQREIWASRAMAVVLLLGILVTGLVQVFFFHMLGGDRYVRRLVSLLGQVWG